MTPKQRGESVEAIVLARILRLGYSVSLPFGNNQRYDMIVDDGQKLTRSQCKTGRLRDGTVVFNAYSTSGGGPKKRYVDGIDEFLVYCFETDGYYRIPLSEVTTNEVRLRVDPTSNSKVRWAKDYQF